MQINPLQGVFLHGVGGLAAGSFYAPLRKIKRWAWESYWLVMGVAAWVVTPWLVAGITTPHLWDVLRSCPFRTGLMTYLLGALWGIGGLTFGLTMRYLGMALGMAVALGFCATFGTLLPPIMEGRFGDLVQTTSGLTVVLGIGVCLAGIGLCGYAGKRRDTELTETQKSQVGEEFALVKGFAMATVSGILSACFAFALAAGKPIAALAIEAGTNDLYSNNAVLVVILAGGFTSNILWCLVLNIKNHTFRDYVTGPVKGQLLNYVLAALGGVVWYHQFFFYGMGTRKLGEAYDFSSWSLHMAFIIIFSNLWGFYFREWQGTSARTKGLVWLGIGVLVVSTVVIGYGNYIAGGVVE